MAFDTMVDVVQQHVAARRPSESEVDVIVNLFTESSVISGTGWKDRSAGMLIIAVYDPQLTVPALAALVRTGKLSWLGNDADPEALACLPKYGPEIGALLRRPGLINDLHAAEPFAAVSLVLAVLQASSALRKTAHADELHMQALQHMQCAAGHCLELQAAGLQQQHPNPLWRFATMALTAQLAAYSAASLPAGSAERLAAMVAFCQSAMQMASDSRAEGDTLEDRHLQMLAYKALVPTMLVLSTLHEVRIKAYLRMQRSPTTAASWLEALSTLITHIVRDGKPVDGDWDSLHGVGLAGGVIRAAPHKSTEAFILCLCRGLLVHKLPRPSARPTKLAMGHAANVSMFLASRAKEVAHDLLPSNSSRQGSNSHSVSGSSNLMYTLHVTPLQTQWQAALAAALNTVLPALEALPSSDGIALDLFSSAICLASIAATSLLVAAGGRDPMAVLAQPSAIALCEALINFLDVPMEHVQHALAVAEPPKGIEYVMHSFRAAASALRCLAMATGEALVAAELEGRPPPPDAMLQCGCNAAGSPQIRLAQAEYECAFVQARRQAGSGRRRQDLEILVQGLELTAQLHGSGAAVRRVFDEQTTAAGLTGLVHKWALPDTPHFSGLGLASLPALQAACKTLALLVAGSGAARQQCMGDSAAGGPGWPEVAAAVRQELRRQPNRVRTLGEKALQQVDAALQGGQQCQQQAGAVSSGKTTAPAPQRSQADADLAMQMLLDEEEQTSSRASKAAQKRARKKAAAKQAAGAAVAASTDSASQQQAQHPSAETGVHTAEPDTSLSAASLQPAQQMRVDTAGAMVMSSTTAAASGQQSADDDWMLCPLSGVVMEDPVMCSDGHTYSRAAITAWLDANGAISPLTSQPLTRSELTPNHALRNTIEAMQQWQTRETSEYPLEDPHCARTM